MNKVILTKEQAKAMEELKSEHLTGEVVKTHLNDRWSLGLESLNDLTVDEFAQAYYSEDGYEVEPEFKKGDYVMVKWKDREKEEFYRVVSTDPWGFIQIETLDGVPNASGHENTRLATPSEIAKEKERRWWSKLDRGNDEYRMTDVVQHKDYKGLYEVVDVYDTKHVEITDDFCHTSLTTTVDKLKLVCPAENRLDVKTNER